MGEGVFEGGEREEKGVSKKGEVSVKKGRGTNESFNQKDLAKGAEGGRMLWESSMERGLIRVNNFPAGLEHDRDNMVILLYNLVFY